MEVAYRKNENPDGRLRPSDLIQTVPNFVALFLLQLASQPAGNNSNRIIL
jgi:hypothetical protein